MALPEHSSHQDLLLYLDHSYLDLFVKGRLTSLPHEKGGIRLVSVYSQETLQEIERSAGFETRFLDVLARLEARYLAPHIVGGRFLDSADLVTVDPHTKYQEFKDSQIDVKGADVLLMRIVQTMTGTRPDLNVADLLAELKRLGVDMGNEALDQAKAAEDLPQDLRDRLQALPRLVEDSEETASATEVKQPASVEEFDRYLLGGAHELNNIRPPRVVEQIWERMPQTAWERTSIAAFFGIEGDPPPSRAEKAQKVFNVLGIVGYFRDPNLKQDRKMDSLMSDMGHAAFASYCHAFATRDERLARKASAAYEFVGCPTILIP
jgi:hypothetical protein